MKKSMSAWPVMASIAAAVVALLSCGNGAPQPPQPEGGWETLSVTLEPLRDHFNRHRDRPRFVALLSPT